MPRFLIVRKYNVKNKNEIFIDDMGSDNMRFTAVNDEKHITSTVTASLSDIHDALEAIESLKTENEIVIYNDNNPKHHRRLYLLGLRDLNECKLTIINDATGIAISIHTTTTEIRKALRRAKNDPQ